MGISSSINGCRCGAYRANSTAEPERRVSDMRADMVGADGCLDHAHHQDRRKCVGGRKKRNRWFVSDLEIALNEYRIVAGEYDWE